MFIKKTKSIGIVLAIVLVMISLHDRVAYADFNNVEELLGEWEGWYYNNSGKMKLNLNIIDVNSENGELVAIFNFAPQPNNHSGKTGSYKMSGKYYTDTQQIELKGTEWLDRPVGYVFFNLSGKVVDNVFKGYTRNYDFEVKRKDSITTNIKLGDYIQFGQYNDEPILWRVINIDEDGDPLLWSEYIISYKAFDGAESGNYNEVGVGGSYSNDEWREAVGSNRWYNSNLREWLNSSQKKVAYTTHPPTQSAIYEGHNAYANEVGFLTNFTNEEQASIKPVIHKVVLAELDKDNADGGRELHEDECDNPEEAMTNYNDAYYEKITDSVFLLSIQELADYVQSRNYEWTKTMTQQSHDKNRSEWVNLAGNTNYYWLRSPSASSGNIVRAVDDDGKVYRGYAGYPRCGVAPALYINQSSVLFTSGQGTKETPYTAKAQSIQKKNITFPDKNLENVIRKQLGKVGGNITEEEGKTITGLDASSKQITNIQGIEKLVNLDNLDISTNTIEDLEPLKQLTQLKTINLTGATTNQTNLQNMVKYLQGKGIKVTWNGVIIDNKEVKDLDKQYNTKTKEELTKEVEDIIQQAGEKKVKVVNNQLTITKELIDHEVTQVAHTKKQIQYKLQQDQVVLNRTIESVVEIKLDQVQENKPLQIAFSKDLANYQQQVDKIYINSGDITLSITPQTIEQSTQEDTLQVVLESRQQDITIQPEDDNGNTAEHVASNREYITPSIWQTKTAIASTSPTVIARVEQPKTISTTVYSIDINKKKGLDKGKMGISLGTTSNKYNCVFKKTKDDSTKEQPLGGKYDNKTKKITVNINDSGDYYVINNKKTFTDIEGLPTAQKEAINILASKEILSGKTDEFNPEKKVSRAEVTAALVKMTYLYNKNATANFSDVKQSTWYYPYIASSKKVGIVSGYGDNTFRPNNSISKIELTKLDAAILAYAKGYKYPTNNATYLNKYKNPQQIAKWAEDYVALATREGLVVINANKLFDGATKVTRKEAAMMLYWLYRKL